MLTLHAYQSDIIEGREDKMARFDMCCHLHQSPFRFVSFLRHSTKPVVPCETILFHLLSHDHGMSHDVTTYQSNIIEAREEEITKFDMS